jgi:hypothetical protein
MQARRQSESFQQPNGREQAPADPIQIEVYRLLRERFASLARCGGPLFAGIYAHHGISGGFYVTEQQ